MERILLSIFLRTISPIPRDLIIYEWLEILQKFRIFATNENFRKFLWIKNMDSGLNTSQHFLRRISPIPRDLIIYGYG